MLGWKDFRVNDFRVWRCGTLSDALSYSQLLVANLFQIFSCAQVSFVKGALPQRFDCYFLIFFGGSEHQAVFVLNHRCNAHVGVDSPSPDRGLWSAWHKNAQPWRCCCLSITCCKQTRSASNQFKCACAVTRQVSLAGADAAKRLLRTMRSPRAGPQGNNIGLLMWHASWCGWPAHGNLPHHPQECYI